MNNDIRRTHTLQTLAVVELCERFGYGFVMQQAAEAWAAVQPDIAHTKGPSRTFTKACTHNGGSVVGCNACYGCGWVFVNEAERVPAHAAKPVRNQGGGPRWLGAKCTCGWRGGAPGMRKTECENLALRHLAWIGAGAFPEHEDPPGSGLLR